MLFIAPLSHLALAATPAAPSTAAATPPPDPNSVTVHVEADRPVQVIGINDVSTARGTVYGSGGETGTVTLTTVHYTELGYAPCDITLPKGTHDLNFRPGGAKVQRFTYDFSKSGATLNVKTSPAALAYGGNAAMLAGVALASKGDYDTILHPKQSSGLPFEVAGAALTVGGIAVVLLPHGKVTVVPAPQPQARLQPLTPGENRIHAAPCVLPPCGRPCPLRSGRIHPQETPWP